MLYVVTCSYFNENEGCKTPIKITCDSLEEARRRVNVFLLNNVGYINNIQVVENLPLEVLDKNYNPPYLLKHELLTKEDYNPKYGDERMCQCGHNYYHHFYSWEGLETVGCEYCVCTRFTEKT